VVAQRMEQENRLLYEKWWLDETYKFNMIPYQPRNLSPERLQQLCLQSRRRFFQFSNVLKRSFDPVNSTPLYLWPTFFGINSLFHTEVGQRNLFPLGDEGWRGELLKVRENPEKCRMVNDEC